VLFFIALVCEVSQAIGTYADLTDSPRTHELAPVMQQFSQLKRYVAEHPYPLIFATVSGAHLYGFPSANSDFDLRGSHVLPLDEVLGLETGDHTVEREQLDGDLELDLVTHDIKKFFELLLKKNGYVLEQVFSPLIVHTTPEHQELIELCQGCLTKHHAHHYLGFANSQWRLFAKETPPRIKPLLYIYRVLLTGIHLMRAGEIEANFVTLNETAQLSYINELVQLKTEGSEKETAAVDMDFHRSEYERLCEELKHAGETSELPDHPTCQEGLNDLLIRIRKQA
jgi:predicted nucleotidyltransferase